MTEAGSSYSLSSYLSSVQRLIKNQVPPVWVHGTVASLFLKGQCSLYKPCRIRRKFGFAQSHFWACGICCSIRIPLPQALRASNTFSIKERFKNKSFAGGGFLHSSRKISVQNNRHRHGFHNTGNCHNQRKNLGKAYERKFAQNERRASNAHASA